MKKNKNPFEEVSGAELFTMSQWEETRMESLIGQVKKHHTHGSVTISNTAADTNSIVLLIKIYNTTTITKHVISAI